MMMLNRYCNAQGMNVCVLMFIYFILFVFIVLDIASSPLQQATAERGVPEQQQQQVVKGWLFLL
jgi:hypothetical protein